MGARPYIRFLMNKSGYLRLIRAICVFSVVGVYLAGNVQATLIHPLAHLHASVSHTEEDESDACHRMVYHGEKEACPHSEHVLEVEVCGLCDILIKQEELVAVPAAEQRVLPTAAYYFAGFSDPTIKTSVQSPSRAPPATA